MKMDFRKEKKESRQAFGELLVLMQQMQTQILALSMEKAITSPLVEDSTPTPFNFNFPSHNVVPPQIRSSSTQVPSV